jgi:hypothetical protein
MALVLALPAIEGFNNGLEWEYIFQKETMGQVIEDIRRYTRNRVEIATIA